MNESPRLYNIDHRFDHLGSFHWHQHAKKKKQYIARISLLINVVFIYRYNAEQTKKTT